MTIPPGYNTVWIRVLGERWTLVHAYFLDGAREDLGQWTGGYRSANSYSPDGTLTDGYTNAHQWVPIPAGRAGELALVPKTNTGGGFWISGVATIVTSCTRRNGFKYTSTRSSSGRKW